MGKDYAMLGFSPATNQFADLFDWRMVADLQQLLPKGTGLLKVFVESSHKRGMKFLAFLRMNGRHGINVENPPVLIDQHPEMTMKTKDGKARGGMDLQ